MSPRDDLLCKFYESGESIDDCAKKFGISHQRVRQILRKAGVWHRKEARPAFLGVDVTEEAKTKLRAEADKRGVSMSRLASEAIDDLLGELK